MTTELVLRSLNKPAKAHWSAIAALIVSVISMVFCGMAVRSEIDKLLSRPDKADPITQNIENSHQSPSKPEMLPQPQVSQPSASESLPLEEGRSDA